MYYVEFNSKKLPIEFVSAFSYTKKARLAEHSDQSVTPLGFEAAELSLRLIITPSLCSAFGVDYAQTLQDIKNLGISRKALPTAVKLGNFQPLRELLFVPTSVHYTTDNDAQNYEFDITLSGIKCAQASTNSRAAGAIEIAQLLPKVILSAGGKELEIKEEITIYKLIETPDGCELGLVVGNDSEITKDSSWKTALVNGGKVRIEAAFTTEYYITSADLEDGILQITASIYPPAAFEATTAQYSETTLQAVLNDICRRAGIPCAVKVSGSLDYCLFQCTPLEMLQQLQDSAGFLIAAQSGKLTFADVPKNKGEYSPIESILTENIDIEPISGIIWNDGVNEFEQKTTDSGSIQYINSCFRCNNNEYAQKRLMLARYWSRSFAAEMPLNSRIVQYSAISVQTTGNLHIGVVDFYQKDYINNMMHIDVHVLE